MAVVLEGGCRVSEMREGEPLIEGTLRIWHQIGRATGAHAISLRVLEFAPGLSPGLRNPNCDEILYWDREHSARLNQTDDQLKDTIPTLGIFIDGWAYKIAPATGIYLRPNQTLTVDNAAPDQIVLISAQCPEPDSKQEFVAPVSSPSFDQIQADKPPIVNLSDRRALPTANRWYRVLIDDEVGSKQVTQFVGSIPPGRAPDHFHNYEEVLFILRGEGRMWAGESHTAIAAGSCIYLPKGQIHCVENIGDDELRLLGVFYPAGSPSARYDVDRAL
jgi:mannose-6-phosphate isomerase-like protein (cupin superfamily)